MIKECSLMTSVRSLFSLSILLAMALVLTGCPKRSTVTPEEEQNQAAQEPAPENPAPADAASAPALEIGADWGTVPQLSPATFGYMKADLSPEARAVLKKNAAILKAVMKTVPSVQLRLEGHCDDRGTLEYNLALGQRRANAVRDYYASLGVSRAALKTISYGEERLACTSATEDCWAQCRRAETTLKSSEPVRIPLSDLPAAQ
jgi:peptidoglycan-associated lipoprotein